MFALLASAVRTDIDRQIAWSKHEVKRQTRYTLLMGILTEVAALAGDQTKNRRGKNRARYLRDNVGCYLVRREAPPSREADCHRRVEMTPRDMADCVGHREHSEPKGERNAEQADADLGKGGGYVVRCAVIGVGQTVLSRCASMTDPSEWVSTTLPSGAAARSSS